MPEPERFLICHLAGIGDLLLGEPAIGALRERYPDAVIDVLCWHKAHSVAQAMPAIDHCHFLYPGTGLKALRHNAGALRALRRQRYDCFVSSYWLFRKWGAFKLRILLAYLRPNSTAGRTAPGMPLVFDKSVDESALTGQHESSRQLAVAALLDATAGNCAEALRITTPIHNRVADWLHENGYNPERLLIGIHAGGKKKHRWPREKFQQLCLDLEARYAAQFVLLGGIEDVALNRSLAEPLRSAFNAAGVFEPLEACALLQRCDLVIANDSAPMHMAARMGRPLVALMGPSDPERFRPLPLQRDKQIILAVEGASDGCGVYGRASRRFTALPVQTVADAVREVLECEPASGFRCVSLAAQSAEPLKVLHVHTLPVISGSGINTFLSMRAQQEAGYDVALATRAGGKLIGLVERNGMRVHELEHMVWGPNPLKDLLAVKELYGLMRREAVQIVHTHNSKAGFVGRLAAHRAKVPVIVHTVHGFAFHESEPLWKRWLYKRLERMADRWCHRFIFISQPLIDWALRERITTPDKIEKIYSGVEIGAFRAQQDRAAIRREFGFAETDFVVGEIAKLWPGKGHADLLEAAAAIRGRLPGLKLLFVGEGELESDLRRQAHALGLSDALVFSGFREDVAHVVHAMDVHVLPSHFEGMGRAILESMAAGIATVGTRVGGIPDLIEDGRTGLLVPVKNAQALGEALLRLYNEEALRRQLASQGQQFVTEAFSADQMCRKINALYASLWRQRGSVTGKGELA